MTRRRKLLLASTAVLAVSGVLALPGVHWRLIGWWRGEPFWQGRPASYYAACIRHALTGPFQLREISPSELWVQQHLPDLLVEPAWAGLPGAFDPAGGDPLPVLLVLADDPDASVRSWAVILVGRLRESAAPALPALVEKLADSNPDVRTAAVEALMHLGPAAGPALPELRKMTTDSGRCTLTSRTVGQYASDAIDTISRGTSPFD